MGHSIANGVGDDDPTYGGAAVPAGVTFRNNGSTLANYPDNAGAGSDPGVVPYWATALAAAGSGRTIIRQAANGAILSQIETQFLPGAIDDCRTLGVDRDQVDCVVIMIGENDSQAGESAPFAARIEQSVTMVEYAFPNARIVLQRIVTTNSGTYPEYATVDAAIVTCAGSKASRAASSASGVATMDTVHYTVAGYAQAGTNQIAAYGATT